LRLAVQQFAWLIIGNEFNSWITITFKGCESALDVHGH
jgi:hypothetical protein